MPNTLHDVLRMKALVLYANDLGSFTALLVEQAPTLGQLADVTEEFITDAKDPHAAIDALVKKVGG